MTLWDSDVRLAIGLIVLIAIALAALTAAGVTQRRAFWWPRCVRLFSSLSSPLHCVECSPHPLPLIAVIAVMFGLATWTSARRLRDQPAPLGLWCWPVALVRQSRSE